MARRKKQFMDDDDPDSSDNSSRGEEGTAPDWDEDPDERAERLRFTDPYGKRTKRKRNGKDDALYGVFAEEEDENAAGPPRGTKSLRRYVFNYASGLDGQKTDLRHARFTEPKRSYLLQRLDQSRLLPPMI